MWSLNWCPAPWNLNDFQFDSLRILWITTKITDLPFIGIGNLKYLQILILWNCHNLVFFPRTWLLWRDWLLTLAKGLLVLRMKEKRMKTIPWNLNDFQFDKLTNLALLPGWLRRCGKTLTYMGLSKGSTLMALPEWLVNLTSLETLIIADCRNLTLPPV